MAPALIPSYNKDLNITPFGEKRLIESFYFLLLRLVCSGLMNISLALENTSITWMYIN